MLVQREPRRRLGAGRSSFQFEPCLPRLAQRPPVGADWIHEIKHDGFRILAHRDAAGVQLITRNRYDLSERFPLIVAAMAALPARSCVVDGEAIACDENGLSVFDRIRRRQHDHAATLCAFDLVELDGEDIRRKPIEARKRLLAKLLRRSHPGMYSIEYYAGDGAIIYNHACALGCEGIVSKRLGSPYRRGRVDYWLKIKNPMAPAVQREAEEDWH